MSSLESECHQVRCKVIQRIDPDRVDSVYLISRLFSLMMKTKTFRQIGPIS